MEHTIVDFGSYMNIEGIGTVTLEYSEQHVSKYLKFTKHKIENRKTFIVTVYSVSGYYLGDIRWHAPWRKYTYYTSKNIILDLSCLEEISKYINYLMESRKNERKQS